MVSLRTVPIIAVISTAPFAIAQTTFYVNGSCGDDAWTGTSSVCSAPNGPKLTIQAAIDASVNGDTVIVADGTYTGVGNKNLDFGGRLITLRSQDGPVTCIIDCENDGRGVYFHNGETTDAVLEGVTIRNGSAVNGGAILCEFASPTILNCVLANNQATESGGGLAIVESSPTVSGCIILGNSLLGTPFARGGGMYSRNSSPTVTDCTFSGNSTGGSSEGWGGGMCNKNSSSTVTNCTFSRNDAGLGGGLFSTGGSSTVTGCTFSGNSASQQGGGMFNAVAAWVANCTFAGNTAGSRGGGMYNTVFSPTVTNCIFDGNLAGSGGGMYNTSSTPIVSNCTFSQNEARFFAGGMYNSSSSPELTNCTFSGNSARSGGGGMYNWNSGSRPLLTHCILWNNDPDQIIAVVGAVTTVRFSDVQGGWPGEGNIDADPRFVDPANGDLHLLSGSPATDAGSNALVPRNLPFDFDGLCRVMDGDLDDVHVVDMGAYEFAGVTADCNANGVCDWIDITNGGREDCNSNAVPDECESAKDRDGDGIKDICDNCPDHFNPDQADCDGDGIGDTCAIANGLSEDCNENGIPDECDLANGFSTDCNFNAVPDECDIASGISPDCNENGILDECEVTRQFMAQSPVLSPFDGSRPQSYIAEFPPATGLRVNIQIEARGDLEDPDEFVNIKLNGWSIGTVFVNNGRACSASGFDEFFISASRFNQAVAGGHTIVTMIAEAAVGSCANSRIRVALSYEAGEVEDCNANGVPDTCDVATGTSRDINGNGIPDECDEHGGPGDLNCDLLVNALDIEPFMVALFDPANYEFLYPDCDIMLGDINGSGEVNSFDIEPFLALLFP